MREALDGREVTVALDGVGGALGRGALELLGAGGRLVLFGFSSGEPTELSAGDLFSRGHDRVGRDRRADRAAPRRPARPRGAGARGGRRRAARPARPALRASRRPRPRTRRSRRAPPSARRCSCPETPSAGQQEGESTGSTNGDRGRGRQHGSDDADLPLPWSLLRRRSSSRHLARARRRAVVARARAARAQLSRRLRRGHRRALRDAARGHARRRQGPGARALRLVRRAAPRSSPGWEDVCGEPGSIDWLMARVGRVLAAA